MGDPTGSKEASTGVDVPRSIRLLTRLFVVTGSVTGTQLRRNCRGTHFGDLCKAKGVCSWDGALVAAGCVAGVRTEEAFHTRVLTLQPCRSRTCWCPDSLSMSKTGWHRALGQCWYAVTPCFGARGGSVPGYSSVRALVIRHYRRKCRLSRTLSGWYKSARWG